MHAVKAWQAVSGKFPVAAPFLPSQPSTFLATQSHGLKCTIDIFQSSCSPTLLTLSLLESN